MKPSYFDLSKSVWNIESGEFQEDARPETCFSSTSDISVYSSGACSFTVRDLSAGGGVRAIVPLPGEKTAVISPEGHFAGDPGVEEELVYIALTESGEQLTLTPADLTS